MKKNLMKKIIIISISIFYLIFFLFKCSSNQQENLIHIDTLSEIITDFYVLKLYKDSFLTSNVYNKNHLIKLEIAQDTFIYSILFKYNISVDRLTKTLEFYLKNPKNLNVLLDNTIQKMQEKINSQ